MFFLAYIKAEPERTAILDNLWEEINNSDIKIVTSAISIIEVSYGSQRRKKDNLLDDQIKKIDSIWYNSSVLIVELTQEIAFQARNLTREARRNRWKLKNYDATHLATACGSITIPMPFPSCTLMMVNWKNMEQ